MIRRMPHDVGSALAIAPILILAATVLLVVWRPGDLNEGLAASLGAILAIAVGGATPGDALRGLAETAQVLAFLLAMMVVATVAY
jgi:Na+/H+ antiporter NhaD/arsenite permease-like protein